MESNTPDCVQGCGPEIMVAKNEEPKQEVVRLSYLALPIRRSDLLLNMCGNEGREDRIQQEAVVREKARAAFFEVHYHNGEELGQTL